MLKYMKNKAVRTKKLIGYWLGGFGNLPVDGNVTPKEFFKERKTDEKIDQQSV